MPIFALNDQIAFPDPELAHPSGVLAVGGDLRPERLLAAYSQGIFPWPAEGYPLMWHAPAERWVVPIPELRVNRTLRKVLHKHPFEVRLDTAFEEVMRACGEVPRPGQDGTWITPEMLDAYGTLHRMGYAHCAEAWQDGQLVGGLYGVALGAAFFGESMFATVDNASKVAFVTLARQLQAWGFRFVDAQVETPLLTSLGARPIPRAEFGRWVREALMSPWKPGRWRIDPALAHGADA